LNLRREFVFVLLKNVGTAKALGTLAVRQNAFGFIR
jgi:hypothetical protein